MSHSYVNSVAASGTGSRRLRRDLSSSVTDALAYSVMVGVGETYLAAFALALSVSQTAAGLIATVPILGGATLQLISPRFVQRLQSNRRWVVLCAAVQAMSFVPLGIGALMGKMPVWALFVTATVYWGAGLAVGPAWNTWMETLVPGRIRAKYFARRSRLSQMAVFLALVGAGFLLQYGRETDQLLNTFAILFCIAGAMRFISMLFLARQSEEEVDLTVTRLVSPVELVRRMARQADGKLIAYLLAVQVAIQISGPYFTPFMLGRLEFSYREYLMLLAASFVAKFLAFPLWGRIAQTLGARKLLWIGGLGIIPMSALWIPNQSVAYLFVVQMLGGVVWAAYDLGVFLLIFESIGREERTSVLTSYNFANAVAMVGGSVMGGILLHFYNESTQGYMILFGLSGVLRIVTLVFLWRVTTDRKHPAVMDFRPLAVRPQVGGIERPVFAALDDREHTNGNGHPEEAEPEDSTSVEALEGVGR